MATTPTSSTMMTLPFSTCGGEKSLSSCGCGSLKPADLLRQRQVEVEELKQVRELARQKERKEGERGDERNSRERFYQKVRSVQDSRDRRLRQYRPGPAQADEASIMSQTRVTPIAQLSGDSGSTESRSD